MKWEWLLRTTYRQPAWIRWALALFFFGLALSVRLLLHHVLLGLPFLTFVPALIGATLLCGVPQALVLLAMTTFVVWLDVTNGQETGPLTAANALVTILLSAAVLAFIVAIVGALLAAVRTNHRLVRQQETLFGELQHRVANSLQFVATMLTLARRDASQGKTADRVLEDAATRITAMARLHRRMYDAATYERGFAPLMREVLAEMFRGENVAVAVVEETAQIPLSHMTPIVLLVTEAATNSLKHVFREGLGSRFEVLLTPLDRDRVRLTIRDDGPGLAAMQDNDPSERGLGLRIMHSLATQLGGKLHMEDSDGTVVWLEFSPG
jgi:two-component system, sensor histidine kinase PdtaS